MKVPHPATTDNVGTGKDFDFWTELNFLRLMELFWQRRVYVDAQMPG
jgi:hypothetical protein